MVFSKKNDNKKKEKVITLEGKYSDPSANKINK